jgi:S-DNA-T family DNA segregation ATPase FtsK/SpoIIIE
MLNWLKKKLQGLDKDSQSEQIGFQNETEQIETHQSGKIAIEEVESPVGLSVSTSNDIDVLSPTMGTVQQVNIEKLFTTELPERTTVILDKYIYPDATLLNEPVVDTCIESDEIEQNKNKLVKALTSFGANIQSITATVGSTDTLYEIIPAIGVRIAKIVNLKEDIALTLNAPGINIIAPIPGKGTIGISIPNKVRQTIYMRSLIETDLFASNSMSLPIALGKKSDNTDYIVDLATLPHLLVAGATGQGKSVGINTIVMSLLYKKHPSELKFVMIDTKQVELIVYEAIEKLFLAKLPYNRDAIVTDATKAIHTLQALCLEMDNRYELLRDAGVRNIKDYYHKFNDKKLDPKRGHKYLPYIVLVIDEFADLVTRSGKEVEPPLTRLAQIGRAVGIHMIASTQHPSSEVIRVC